MITAAEKRDAHNLRILPNNLAAPGMRTAKWSPGFRTFFHFAWRTPAGMPLAKIII